jgi:hypothetical protein
MTGLAFSLRGTLGGNIAFMTAPFAEAPSDPNRVVLTEEADALWSAMSADLPLVDPAPEPAPADPAAPAPTAADPAAEATPTPGVDPITADDVSTVCG